MPKRKRIYTEEEIVKSYLSKNNHAKWIWDDEVFYCSKCFFRASGDTLECMNGTFQYCPHCGAIMECDLDD